MQLYDLPAGMNPRRVRIFLAEKGIEIPTTVIDMMQGENQTPAFLAMNPLGTMPVLELDNGVILTESIAICRYFEEQQPEPNLFGASTEERALVEMWNRRIELELLKPMSDQFRHLSPFWEGRVTQVAAYGELARAKVFETMSWIDQELAGREYIVGDRYTVADITAQCALLLGRNTGARIPDSLNNLNSWWSRVSSRPSARA